MIKILSIILILSPIYMYIKNQKIRINEIALVFIGFLLLTISNWKTIEMKLGFGTFDARLERVNDEKLKELRNRISRFEIHYTSFNESKAREELEARLSDNVQEKVKLKFKCEKDLNPRSIYFFKKKDYKELKATELINTCKNAVSLNLDNSELKYFLAIAYYKNLEYDKTILILNKLANKCNYSIAQRKLAIMYLFGDLVSIDKKKSKEYFYKSAKNGDRASQEILNEIF